ncbi:MAG: DUF1080 domain-containing protein [Phycisphaerae bacterium]|nr:DUF1080 domain-containing protein [Phycisphaerae bacterium]
MTRLTVALLLSLAIPVSTGLAVEVPKPANEPPKGFTPLFNGKNLAGWRGLGHTNPYDMAKWSGEERREKQAAANDDMGKHWRVEAGQIINDGHGVYLTTEQDYGDIELLVDWNMMVPNADSGIYLRGSPQVQIWDPTNKEVWPLGADKGSGSLWNNEKPEGKFPLVKADKPVGQWNRFRILMIGHRVTVYFNDQLVVKNAVMENYWDRSRPLPPRGPIQLQTHGGEMRFANVFIREIPAEEADRFLGGLDDKGFKTIFNGKDLNGWTGATGEYVVKEGVLSCKAGGGGTLLTKEEYSDFAIRFEFKLPPGGNNGLAIRSPLEGNPAFVGMELQILDDGHEKYKGLQPWQVHGSVYGVVPAHRGYLRPPGQWNYQEVLVKGSKIQVSVNGTLILDADLSKVEKPLDEQAHPGMRRTQGHIGFMGHGDPVEFRNIRLKVLK